MMTFYQDTIFEVPYEVIQLRDFHSCAYNAVVCLLATDLRCCIVEDMQYRLLQVACNHLHKLQVNNS